MLEIQKQKVESQSTTTLWKVFVSVPKWYEQDCVLKMVHQNVEQVGRYCVRERFSCITINLMITTSDEANRLVFYGSTGSQESS